MPELALDLPELHKYLFNHVIKPLVDQNMMSLKFVRFDKELPKPEDPDEYVFDSTDYSFRLLALIINNEITKNSSGLDEFIKSNNYSKIFKQLWGKIEYKDDLWENIK